MPTVTPTPPRTMKGITLTPRSFSPSDFTGFLAKAKEAGSIVSWEGDWGELASSSGGGPKVVAELAPTYDYMPVIVLQFFTQSSGQLLRPLDAATVTSYRESAHAFAEKYKPHYLGLGIEVNILYEKSPADFDGFVGLFGEVYDAVKSASPDTKVFTVFQLERMKGLHGGLFGGTNDPSKVQWHLLDRFSRSDIIAFTTYPDLIYKDPKDIPSDYYAEIAQHTSKPIVFVEVGWHSAASPRGWESSEAEQGEFVKTFFDQTRDLRSEIVIWSFMYDQSTIEPFNSMGLLRSDGGERPAWQEWVRAG
ncbi:MAG: hypothetical protein HY683_03820 [Chloroflexi bacterium]|nr:hypothetical protein [Chloroflexota bacterium]